MILENVYKLALPRHAGKKVKKVIVGLALMGVELDNGSIGVTYVLRKEIDDVCASLPQSGTIVGMPAEEIAKWALQG